MSAHVEESRPAARLQLPAFDSILAAGWGPLAAVAACGFSLGFFAWYEAIVPLHRPTLIQVALLFLPLLSGAGAVALWSSYSHYFSMRTGVKYQRSLEYDALSWLPMLALWASFVLPFWVTRGGAGLLLYCITAFCLTKLAVAIRFNLTVREVSIDFVVTRFAIIVIAELAAAIIGQRPGVHVQESRNLLLNVWGRWDAVHYIDIATVGYHGTDMAFFPLYPLLIALLGALVGNHLVAGLIISNVAFFFGLLYLYKLFEHEFDRAVARRAIFYVSIFPTALYFSAVYTESLFFMLTVASFYYMRERRWWLAGVIGFFASMTRVEGVLLTIPFIIEWTTANWAMLRELYYTPAKQALRAFSGLIPLLFIPLGLAVYMGYLWVLNGDPLYFSHVQINWNRHLAAPWTAVWNTIHKISVAAAGAPTAANQQTIANQTLELVFTALMLAVLVGGWRKLKPSYIAYMALSILVPISTSSLMSMPRFALVLFPMFGILALWGARPATNNAIVAFSLPLLGLYTVLFADWYWVA
ncbi:MAG TPA: mannosyltransferase family protein [Candidatus Baltobacteraceae bacterium]|nr:mannosyltransferase family protein [Candidatus Baltobacteraceae bacterium]